MAQVKTAHELARELLAGPDKPVKVAVSCEHRGEVYNIVGAQAGQYRVSDQGDCIQVESVDESPFEYVDSEYLEEEQGDRASREALKELRDQIAREYDGELDQEDQEVLDDLLDRVQSNGEED